nr:restriction endonuclease subunit S [uncultured Emticicia sp.]
MIWEKVKIKTISKQIRGVSYSPKDVNDNPRENYSMLLRANNVTDDGIKLSDKVYVSNECISDTQKLQIGDILIVASSGSKKIVGRAAMVEDELDASFGAFCKVIRPNDKINHGFLSYYFRTLEYRNTISDLSAGANINNLRNEDLDNLEIPLPPLPIQKRIAEILDTADALRRKDEALLKKYDELAQAIFIDMFGDPVKNEKGWEVKKLGEVCDKITDGTHDTPERLTKGVKFITGKHIRPFTIDYDNSDYVTEDVHNEIYKRCNPEIGDILYTNIGVNYATAAMNTVNYQFSMKNVALLKYNRAKLSGRYLEHQLNNEFFKAKLKTLTGIGGAQQFLSLAQIKSISILIPNKKLQLEFENLIDKVYKIIEKQRLNTDYSTNLFNSLLQKAFNGELIV